MFKMTTRLFEALYAGPEEDDECFDNRRRRLQTPDCNSHPEYIAAYFGIQESTASCTGWDCDGFLEVAKFGILPADEVELLYKYEFSTPGIHVNDVFMVSDQSQLIVLSTATLKSGSTITSQWNYVSYLCVSDTDNCGRLEESATSRTLPLTYKVTQMTDIVFAQYNP